MFKKSLKFKKRLTPYEQWLESLYNQYRNPDILSNCISYCVNSIWHIRDKSKNNKIILTFKSESEYLHWQNSYLYDD